jgi:hypothetical protein
MRFRTALSLASIFIVCLTLASWATPIPDRIVPARPVPYPDTGSQAGRIVSIGDASFSLEVMQGEERKTLEFLVDGNTKVQGKLEVGSQATVEYRSADGKKIAIRVAVAPAAGRKTR